MSHSIPSFFRPLRQGDVFIGRQAHTLGKTIRVEGAEGPRYLVRHKDTGNIRPMLPTTLFSAYQPTSEEEGMKLYPWDGERKTVQIDAGADRVVHRRNSGKRAEGGHRTKLEPTTGDVSVESVAAPEITKSEPAASPAPPPPAAVATVTKEPESAFVLHAIERMEERFERQEARFTMLLEKVLDRIDAAPAHASPAPVKTKEEEREEATNKQVAEQMPWARPQLERFIEETMEFVTFATQAEIDRALRPGEVFDQFSLWCKVNDLTVPHPKTVYRALLIHPRANIRKKISGKEELTPLAIRRQTRFGFDESQPIGKDVRTIVEHARRTAWPDLKEEHRETIGNLLMAKVSKADILMALDHIAAMPGRGKGAYTPDKVLNERHINALVRIARAESGQ